jgi:hypothetical protein
MKHANILTAPIALLSGSRLLGLVVPTADARQRPGGIDQFRLRAGGGPAGPSELNAVAGERVSDLARTMTKTPMTTASGDWVDSDYFSRKSLKADRGQTVQPENNANWLVPLADRIDDHWWAASRVQLLCRLRFSAKPIERVDEQ